MEKQFKGFFHAGIRISLLSVIVAILISYLISYILLAVNIKISSKDFLLIRSFVNLLSFLLGAWIGIKNYLKSFMVPIEYVQKTAFTSSVFLFALLLIPLLVVLILGPMFGEEMSYESILKSIISRFLIVIILFFFFKFLLRKK